MNLRRGLPEESAVLDDIALAAKAHWGYSPAQLKAWQEDLRVRPERFNTAPVCVADEEGQPLGFVQVATDRQPWEIEALWVHPKHMGRGIGKALLAWATELAAASGQGVLAIDADPNATRFYLARGARQVGAVAAPIAGNPERVRPQLRLRTSAA